MTPDFSRADGSLRIIAECTRDRYKSTPRESDAMVLSKTLDRAKASFAGDDQFRQSCDICEMDADRFQAILLK